MRAVCGGLRVGRGCRRDMAPERGAWRVAKRGGGAIRDKDICDHSIFSLLLLLRLYPHHTNNTLAAAAALLLSSNRCFLSYLSR